MTFSDKHLRMLRDRLARKGREICFRWGGPAPNHDPLDSVWCCLEWQGTTNENGYGSTGCPSKLTPNGKRTTERVHRLA
jgi:hypothetical protein